MNTPDTIYSVQNVSSQELPVGSATTIVNAEGHTVTVASDRSVVNNLNFV